MTDPVFALEPDVPRNVRLARWLLFRLLSGLREGSLTVREGAQTFHFGDPAAALRAEARVCTPEVYWRLLTGGSLAAAEAWMDGDWESHQLTALLQILARNGKVLGRLERGFRLLGKPVARLRHWTRRNTRAQARENIAAHYDLGNEFYAHFLDEDLLYSSALFTDDQQDLTQAQRAKMARLCDQLALNPGDHLLEIGTGWGALAEYAARHYGCRVTTTTLSREQHRWATERMARAGLQDRVEVLLCDYRDLRGEYDKLVSVEMIEAVGQRYLPAFFRTCQARLRPGGRMALQAITIQDQRYRDYSKSVDFIQRYIFPGGFLPSITAMSELMTRHTDFVVRNLFDMGPDYARTLAHWRQRFTHAWQDIEKLGFDERFRRMWLYYFGYCEAGFNARTISVVQLTAERDDTPGAVPADGPRVRCLLDAGGDVARARSADLADAGPLRLAAAAGGQPSARPAVGRGGLRPGRLLGAGGADRFSRRQPAAPVDGGPVADVRRRLDPTDPHHDASRLGAGRGRHRRRPGGLPARRAPRSHDPAGADGACRGRHGLRLAGAHAVIPSGDGEAKMRFALLLLWLTTLAPAAHAADWLTWRRVGEATLTWGPFTVYHSQLRTPNGRYDGPQQDRALIITYQRDIDREALVEATRDQWQAQGILQQEPRSEAWLRMLQGIWPDVAPGSQLAFVDSGSEGQFWYRASAAQTAFTPLGPRQSAAFSTRFLAIWLDPRTTYPELRQQLIGGTP